jgi:hypothetical protein
MIIETLKKTMLATINQVLQKKVNVSKNQELEERFTSSEVGSTCPSNEASSVFSDYPECWSKARYNYFEDENSWLVITNKKLGRSLCA